MTITKFRNYYEITDYKLSKWNKDKRINEGTCPELDKKFMCYENYMGHFHKKDKLGLWDKKNKILRLPIGVDFRIVQDLLYTAGNEWEFVDKSNEYIEPHTIDYDVNTEYQIRNKYQAEGIDFLTSGDLFYSKLLALATGYGKTYVSIVAAFRMKMPMLIISETLCDQWIERIQQYTSCRYNTKEIVLLKGTNTIINLLEKKSFHQAKFYITTSSTLSSSIEKYGKDTVNKAFERIGIGIKCFDEFHLHFYQNIFIDMMLATKYTWYLTATPTRTDSSERSVFKFIMTNIPVYGLQTFEIDTYFNFRLISYDTEPNNYEIQHCMTSKGLSSALYWNYIFRNKEKMKYIFDMVITIINELLDEDEDMKIIIYLAKLDHIETMKRYLEAYYRDTDIKFGNYTSIIDKKKKRREINRNIIFTTLGSGGVGLDVPNLRASLCLVPFTSPITCSQVIGRLRYIEGKELYFYDFIDSGFKVMEWQRRKRLSIYKKKAKTIKSRKF